MNERHGNRLVQETSPYLRQHAHNPVDWFPWGDEALKKAREEDKPILLSIGYSACHWCHVMAHESFENPETARVMNELFINIKVDREERPDLDKIYQFCHQLLTQKSGGWPLTVVLSPTDSMPFFAGTYFPDKPRYHMPAFTQVLQRVARFYHENRDAVAEQNEALLQVLQQQNRAAVDDNNTPNAEVLDQARYQLAQQYDKENGGFGRAPKFPHPTSVERLLGHWHQTRCSGNADSGALEMALHTLRAMAGGGVYDQLGGGFFRYSVDDQWMIPHFEKMLYDNGPLLNLLTQTWQISGDDSFRQKALQTASWVVREMQSPGGGYYATLDADSEGQEGLYYTWTREQLRQALSGDEYALLAQVFGLERDANFEGRWHLHTFVELEQVVQQLEVEPQKAEDWQSMLEKLRQLRAERIPPGRDEKILCAWNGLMIKAMATAGRVFDQPHILDSAQEALDFIISNMSEAGRLRACYKDGQARFNAYLDDYAFVLDGIIALLEARWQARYLACARQLADHLLSYFYDQAGGGFYFTANDHEPLIQRPKPFADEAIPAGNGIAAGVLQKLGLLLGESRYLDAATGTLKAAWPQVQASPYAHCALLEALDMYLYPPRLVIIRGTADGDDEEARHWQRRVQQVFDPKTLVFAIPGAESVDALPEALRSKAAVAQTVAYVCEGTQCRVPLTDIEDLISLVHV